MGERKTSGKTVKIRVGLISASHCHGICSKEINFSTEGTNECESPLSLIIIQHCVGIAFRTKIPFYF